MSYDNLTSDLANVGTVISSVSDWVVDMIQIFMDSPLILFVGFSFTVAGLKVGKRLLRPR